MKRNFLPLGVGLLLCSFLGQFAHAENEAKVTEAEVKLIRHWYNKIQSDKSLKKTMIKSGEDEEPHGVIVTRYENASGELKKLHVSSGGEHGGEDVTYYYHDGSLFFVYSAYQSWRFTGKAKANGETETIDSGGQSRYYFANGKCIRALGKNAQTKEADQLAALLKKAKNQPIVHHETAPIYLKKSKMLLGVKTRAALEKYLSKRD